MENLTLVALCIVLGWLLQRVHVFKSAPEVLNAWVIWVALPAVIFFYLPQIRFDERLLGLVAVPWVLLALTAGLVLWLSRQLKFKLPQGLGQPFAIGMAIKMGLMPLLALWLIYLLDMHGLPAQTALLEAAMPTMITAGVVAASHHLQPRLASAMVGWGCWSAFLLCRCGRS